MLIRQLIFYFWACTVTTSAVITGYQDLTDTIGIEEKVVEVRNYAYEPRLKEVKITTTTEVVKKTSFSEKEQRCPEFEQMFKDYGLKPAKTFSYIAWKESRCQPDAVNAKWDDEGNVTWTLNKNGSIDRGLLQINSSWRTVTYTICKSRDMDILYTLDCNLKVAKYLLDNGGLGHWGL